MKRKQRKKLKKHLRRLVSKHGPDVAIALVTGLVTNMITDRLRPEQSDSSDHHRAGITSD
jgi:hypothetical protein